MPKLQSKQAREQKLSCKFNMNGLQNVCSCPFCTLCHHLTSASIESERGLWVASFWISSKAWIILGSWLWPLRTCEWSFLPFTQRTFRLPSSEQAHELICREQICFTKKDPRPAGPITLRTHRSQTLPILNLGLRSAFMYFHCIQQKNCNRNRL